MTLFPKPPSRLYKYYSFTAQSLENLKNQQIYFNSPKNFNDPYDCSIEPVIRVPSDAEIESIRSRFLRETLAGSREHIQSRQVTTERLKEMVMKSAKEVVAKKIEEFGKIRGVSCFSEECDDLLMWAHYAGNYKGFCLEFDTSFFHKLRKVRYSATMPTFDLVPILEKQLDESDFMSIFSTKSLSWAYEKEWRFFHEKAGTSFGYPPEALTGVYFGPEVTRAALEIICLILKGQNESVRFWQGVRHPSKYKVEFNNIYYFSHLQAQKHGYCTNQVPVSYKPLAR